MWKFAVIFVRLLIFHTHTSLAEMLLPLVGMINDLVNSAVNPQAKGLKFSLGLSSDLYL